LERVAGFGRLTRRNCFYGHEKNCGLLGHLKVAATGDYEQFNWGNGRDYRCAGEGVRGHLEEYVPEDSYGKLPA
jgi:hypothetical protein